MLAALQGSTSSLEAIHQEKKELAVRNMRLIEHCLVKEGSVPELAISRVAPVMDSGVVMMKAEFNQAKLPSYLKTKSSGRRIIHTQDRVMTGAAFGIDAYPENSIYEAKFKICKSKSGDAKNMMFGAALDQHSNNQWIGQVSASWSINRNTGRKVHSGNGAAYAEVTDPGSNGTTVSVVVNTQQGSLSFIINGKVEGNAYIDSTFKSKKIYPAVSIERKTDEIEFVSFAPYSYN